MIYLRSIFNNYFYLGLIKVLSIASLLLLTTELFSESFRPKISIDGTVVTSYDISQKKKFMKLVYGRDLSNNEVADLLISETIKLQYATDRNILINESFIKSQLEEILNKSANNKSLKEVLIENSISEEVLYSTIKTNIFWAELIKREFASALIVSETDILEMKPKATQIIAPRIKLSVLFLPYKLRGEKNTVQLMNRLIGEIKQGANFSTLAKRFSKDMSARKGGSLGWRELSSFNKNIADEIIKTKVGELTKPVKVIDGIYLFKVENVQTKINPRTINMTVEYLIIPKSSDKTVNCKNSGNNDLRGPFKLQKLREKQRVLIQRLKIDERQKYDQDNDIILCKKEPDLSPKERTEIEMAITTEKLKRFGEGLYQSLRQNTVIEFHD